MAYRNQSLLEILVDLPWWVSFIASVLVYSVFAFILPSISTDNIYL